MMYRQGDILFIMTSEVFGQRQKSLIILSSDVTGHSHTLTAGEIYSNEPSFDHPGNFYVRVPEGAKVKHEEHKTISLPAGCYEVRRQREVTGYVRD